MIELLLSGASRELIQTQQSSSRNSVVNRMLSFFRIMRITILTCCFFVSACLFGGDPSLTPVHRSDGKTYDERLRIWVDLDGDGHKDLLVSDSITTFGNAGGGWGVYLWRNGEYKQIGEISAHPKAISFEHDHYRNQRDEKDRYYARIWAYSRSNNSIGVLGYYRVGPSSVTEFTGLEIYPGGSDIGATMYQAVMDHTEFPFIIEQSKTTEKGKVTWQPYER